MNLVQVKVGVRTPEQDALEETYAQAAKILRAAGIDAQVVGLCCFEPGDNPCVIHIKGTIR